MEDVISEMNSKLTANEHLNINKIIEYKNGLYQMLFWLLSLIGHIKKRIKLVINFYIQNY